jgi:UrcA family protein
MNFTTPHTVRAAVMIALCMLASAGAMAQTTAINPAESRSKTVSLAGLDLSTPEGVDAARDRLHQTARHLCSQLAGADDLWHQPNYVKCVDDATANAVQQLSNPAQVPAQAALGQPPALKSQIPGTSRYTRSTKVSLSDLDISTPEGARAASERLRENARRLCSQVADDLDLSHQSNFIACVDAAMASALPKLETLTRKSATTAIVARNHE